MHYAAISSTVPVSQKQQTEAKYAENQCCGAGAALFGLESAPASSVENITNWSTIELKSTFSTKIQYLTFCSNDLKLLNLNFLDPS